MNHRIEKPKIENAESEENLKKAEFNSTVDIKILIEKTLIDPKVLHMRIRQRNNQKEQASEENYLVFTEITERFGLLFAGKKIVKSEELK